MKDFQVTFCFLVDHILWIASFLESVLKLSNIRNKITFLGRNSSHSRFCVTRVTWRKVKVLMAISRFPVEIGDKFTMINFNSNIKEINFLSRTLMCKLYIGMKIIDWFVPKKSSFFFTGCPYQKNIINVPKPNLRLNLFIFEKLILHAVHISTRIWWGKFCTNSCSRYLS